MIVIKYYECFGQKFRLWHQKYNNFGIDIPAVSDELDPTNVAKQKELQEKYKSIASSRN